MSVIQCATSEHCVLPGAFIKCFLTQRFKAGLSRPPFEVQHDVESGDVWFF